MVDSNSSIGNTYLHMLPPDILGIVDNMTIFKQYLIHIFLPGYSMGESPHRYFFIKAYSKDDVLREFIHCDANGTIALLFFMGSTSHDARYSSMTEDFHSQKISDDEMCHGTGRTLYRLYGRMKDLFFAGMPDTNSMEQMGTYFAFLKENEEDILQILATKFDQCIRITEVNLCERMF